MASHFPIQAHPLQSTQQPIDNRQNKNLQNEKKTGPNDLVAANKPSRKAGVGFPLQADVVSTFQAATVHHETKIAATNAELIKNDAARQELITLHTILSANITGADDGNALFDLTGHFNAIPGSELRARYPFPHLITVKEALQHHLGKDLQSSIPIKDISDLTEDIKNRQSMKHSLDARKTLDHQEGIRIYDNVRKLLMDLLKKIQDAISVSLRSI